MPTTHEVSIERSGAGFILRIGQGRAAQCFHCSSESMVRHFVAAFASPHRPEKAAA